MINAANLTGWAHSSMENGHNAKMNQINSEKIKYAICPVCGRKEYYKIQWRYEHCRHCGMYRILVPGQDF